VRNLIEEFSYAEAPAQREGATFALGELGCVRLGYPDETERKGRPATLRETATPEPTGTVE